MTAKITMHIARDDLSKRIIQWIQFLSPKLSPVTDKEIALLVEVFNLPDKFLAVPFSTIPKRLYCERLSIEGLALQRMIASLFKKGYLIKDEYEEYDVLPLLKNTMIRGLKASKIRFELDWNIDPLPVKESISKPKREIKKEIVNDERSELQSANNNTRGIGMDIPQEQKIVDAPALNIIDSVQEQKQRLAEYRARKKETHAN